jgi:HK97 family phage prohead protease
MNMEYKEFPIEIKQEDVQEDGFFKGIASPFGGKADSGGDIVHLGAFTETLANGGRNGFGVAMLWSHDPKEPIGTWISLVEEKKGLMVEGKLTMGVQRANETHLLMKDGAVKGLSIGFNPAEDGVEHDDKKRIRHLRKLDLWEISPVVFPMATRARITNVKSLIEEATSIRDLEKGLRDSGLTKYEAQNIISICKSSVRESWANREMLQILDGLESANLNISRMDKKGVIPFKSYPLASLTATWSGSTEVRKADVNDLKRISTWFDSSSPDVKSSYKLPHHRAEGFTTVWRGVAAAMGALLGARGGVNIPSGDKRGVYSHLARHYEQFEKEPPEFKTYSEMELEEIFKEEE